jgi:hypothetical protein
MLFDADTVSFCLQRFRRSSAWIPHSINVSGLINSVPRHSGPPGVTRVT